MNGIPEERFVSYSWDATKRSRPIPNEYALFLFVVWFFFFLPERMPADGRMTGELSAIVRFFSISHWFVRSHWYDWMLRSAASSRVAVSQQTPAIWCRHRPQWCVYIVWTESYLLSVKLRYTFFSPTIKIYENAINCKFFFSLGPFCFSSSNGLCVCVCVLGCATAFIVQHWCTNLCAWSSMAFFARYVVSGPLLLAANISNDHRSAELWRCEAFLLFAALAARSIRQKSSLSASKKNQIDDVHMIWADADVYSLCLLHISATATERCETV